MTKQLALSFALGLLVCLPACGDKCCPSKKAATETSIDVACNNENCNCEAPVVEVAQAEAQQAESQDQTAKF